MWTMPRRTLQFVAALIVACAIGGFVLGLAGTPPKARLPGESTVVGTPIEATDAKPLSGVVEAAKPPEPEAKPEEDEKKDEEEEAALPPPPKLIEPPPSKAPPPPPAAAPPEDAVGDLIDGISPQDAAPPF